MVESRISEKRLQKRIPPGVGGTHGDRKGESAEMGREQAFFKYILTSI
jgi:hypothetical protein